jgi:hypothetical protein
MACVSYMNDCAPLVLTLIPHENFFPGAAHRANDNAPLVLRMNDIRIQKQNI